MTQKTLPKYALYSALITISIWLLAIGWLWFTHKPTPGLIRPISQEQEWRIILYNEVLASGGDYWDYRLLYRIAEAESNFRQFQANGEVLRGRKHQADTGLFQINKSVHSESAESLGLDIEKPEDNIRFAVLLYNDQGTIPWRASKSKWAW